MSNLLVYAGSAIIAIWGIAHIIPVRSVVAGFGEISEDNRKILLMEWTAGGLMLICIGTLSALVVYSGGTENPVSGVVILASAVMLLVYAGLTALTGATTASVPIQVCPFVTIFVAILFLSGVLL